MKKFLLLTVIACALSACQYTRPTTVDCPTCRECPSCNPPIRHYEVVTECSEFMDRELPDGSYTQCRRCVNKVYHDGVEVTGLSTAKKIQTQTQVNSSLDALDALVIGSNIYE